MPWERTRSAPDAHSCLALNHEEVVGEGDGAAIDGGKGTKKRMINTILPKDTSGPSVSLI